MKQKNHPSVDKCKSSRVKTDRAQKSFLGRVGIAKCKGFSLAETLIAIFIFSLAVTMLSGSFSSFLKNYSDAKQLQKNMESAQYGMNLFAKTMRTSKIVSYWLDGNGSAFCSPSQKDQSLCTGNVYGFDTIRAWDYSQNKCYRFQIDSANHVFLASSVGLTDESDCTSGTGGLGFVANNEFSTGIMFGKFEIDPKIFDEGHAGKVSIYLKLGRNGQPQNDVSMQTSVSLRNFQ